MNSDINRQLKRGIFLAIVSMAIVVLVLGTSTFAWFTSNTQVETSKVTARTSDEDVSLLVSSSATNFVGSEECDIVQVNAQDQEKLIPVSTRDLSVFVHSGGSNPIGSSGFSKVTDEAYYYHGRIYVKAEGPESMTGQTMSVYIDNTEGRLVPDLNSEIASAARIGMAINGTNPVIYSLSDTKLTTRENNTSLNGVILDDGYVLDGSGSTVLSYKDPSIAFPKAGSISEKPAFDILINQIYPLDIYFYLEGCDADCTEDISLDGITFSLGFVGTLGE